MCNSAIQKNLFFAFICLFLFTSESRTGFAQSTPLLTKFNGTAYNNQVYLSWEIGQGSTCNGIGVMRSVDSVSFVEIGSIEGVCGSTSEPQSYTFTDLTPQSNRTNYYRLNLGGLAFSSVLKFMYNKSVNRDTRSGRMLLQAIRFFFSKTPAIRKGNLNCFLFRVSLCSVNPEPMIFLKSKRNP